MERRDEINCLARFRFSVLDIDGVVVAVLLLVLFDGIFTPVVNVADISMEGGMAMLSCSTGTASFAKDVGMILLVWAGGSEDGGGMRRFFVFLILPFGITAVENKVRSMCKVGVGRCAGTEEDRVTVDNTAATFISFGFLWVFTGTFRAK